MADGSLAVGLDRRLAGYRAGGIARYVHELHARLRVLPDVNVVPLSSVRDACREPGDVTLRTPPHHRLESWSIPIELLMHRVRLDVYHAPDFIAPHLPGIPRVATVHDLSFVHWPDDLETDALTYYRRLQQSRRWTRAWITPSHWTARELTEIYDIDPATIYVIPHGVSLDLQATSPLPREARGDYILAVGTIEPRKQYDILIQAVGLRRPTPRIVVVGQRGWNSGNVERRLQQSGRIIWMSNVDDEALRRLYAEAIALAIPSRVEGFGLPALEAMAVGTPVISSAGGALPEVTGSTSLDVSDPSPDAWSEALQQITEDIGFWQKLSAAARVRAAMFSWEQTALDTLQVYRSVRS